MNFPKFLRTLFFTERFWTTASVSDSTSDIRPCFIGEEKLRADECVVPDPKNTEDEIRLLCSPNDKDTTQADGCIS